MAHRRRWFIASLLCLPCLLPAAFRPIARALPERFDAGRKAWVTVPTQVELDADAGRLQLRLPTSVLGQPLNARLDFKHLPHYGDWLAQRQAEGGASWTALKAVLDELGDGPALALSHAALSTKSPLECLLGLRRGSHFELIATVRGRLSACGKELCFEPGQPLFSDPSTGLAWDLLQPMLLQQAKNAAKR